MITILLMWLQITGVYLLVLGGYTGRGKHVSMWVSLLVLRSSLRPRDNTRCRLVLLGYRGANRLGVLLQPLWWQCLRWVLG